MIAQALPYETDPEARAARRLAVAQRLVEMGLAVAEAVQARAMAQLERDAAADADGAPEAAAETGSGRRFDPVAAVERVGRMVRLSLALEARLDEGEPLRRARLRDDAKAQREADKAAEFQAMLAERAEDERRQAIVVDAAVLALEQDGADEAEVLERIDEITERLHEGEREFDVRIHPIGAVLAQLFAAIEIDPDWSLWAEEDWAIEEAATNAKGSPYAAGYKPPAARPRAADAPETPAPEPADAGGASGQSP